MFGLKKLLSKQGEKLKQVQNRDEMQAIVAAGVLVAFADGDCSDDELKTLSGILDTHDALQGFGSEIGQTLENYTKKMKASKFLGEQQLLREIADVKGDETQKTDVAMVALSIAFADGDCSDVEKKVLQKIGKTLGVSIEQYF